MSDSESLVETVARALGKAQGVTWTDTYVSYGACPDYPHKPAELEALARTAIRAMRELVPVIRDHEGFPAHQLVGAPEDVWRAFIDAALA